MIGMLTPGSGPLQNLSGNGFLVKRRLPVPGLKLYREATVEDAAQDLSESRAIQLQKDELKVELGTAAQAESFARIADHGPASLSTLSKMAPARRNAVVKGLSKLSSERQTANIQRMVENSVLPTNLAGQLAQWSGTENAKVSINRKPQLEGRIPDAEEMAQLSKKAEDLGAAPGYIIDGCQTRGHLQCNLLRDEGVNSSKIFAKGKLRVADAKLRELKDGTVGKGSVGWKYHTAPLVMVEPEPGAEVEPRVWDPNLARATKADSEWFHPKDWISSFSVNGEVEIGVESDSKYTPYSLLPMPFSWTTNTAKRDLKAFNAEAKDFQDSQQTLAARLSG